MSAWITGILGTLLSYWLATRVFGLSCQGAVQAVVVSNFAAFISLLATLALERQPQVKRLMRGYVRTCGVLAAFYLSLLLALNPALREAKTMAWMFAPLILSAGFSIPAFGYVQDGIVRRSQRRARAKSS